MPGKYYVEIADVGRSWEFAIGPDVYGRAWYLAMRSIISVWDYVDWQRSFGF